MLRIQSRDIPFFEMRDLTGIGVPEIPTLGLYRFSGAQAALAPHTHRGLMEICYLARGRQIYTTAGRDYVLAPGDFFVSLPDEVHSTGGHPQGRGALHWLNINLRHRPLLGLTPAAAAPLVRGLLGLKSRQFRAPAGVADALDSLQQRVRGPQAPLTTLSIRKHILTILLAVVEAGHAVPPSEACGSMNRVLAHIDANLDRPIGIPELAAKAGLSVSWFQSRFRREVGMPPADYVLRRRLDRAAGLLKSGRHSVTDVAFMLGFSSSQYFATAFRRHHGLTPRRTRGSGLS